MTRPGPRLVALEIADDLQAWTDAGFAERDGATVIGALAIVPTGRAGHPPTLVFDRAHPSGATDLDGIAWRADAGLDPGPATEHPNGIDGFDHLVVMAPDLERVRASILGAGLEIRRERAARLGRSEIVQVFAWAGEVLLEVVAPAAPSDDGRSSEVWGVAFVASDLDATAVWFGDACSAPKDAVQPGRRIATLRHQALGMTLTAAVMSARTSANPTKPSD